LFLLPIKLFPGSASLSLPHHYRNSTVNKNDRLMLDFTAEGDALAWAETMTRRRG